MAGAAIWTSIGLTFVNALTAVRISLRRVSAVTELTGNAKLVISRKVSGARDYCVVLQVINRNGYIRLVVSNSGNTNHLEYPIAE